MQVRLWTSTESGVNIAYLEMTSYTPTERVQGTKFGPLKINLGGAFAAPASGQTAAINFALEPLYVVIDPNNVPEIKFQKVFRTTAEIPDPAYAAKVFCDTNLARITDAVTNWKSLTDEFIVNYNTTL